MKVMTLNCNYLMEKHGSWLKRKPLIRDTIEEHQPEVIVLQAVAQFSKNSQSIDQAREIGQAGNYPYYSFQMAEASNGTQKGQAVISRHTPARLRSFPLSLKSGLEDHTRRLLVATSIETEEGIFHVFNAHYSWVKEQERENLAESLLLLKNFPGMTLLLGDFNMTPDSPLLEPLNRAGFSDVWSLCQKQDGGFTFESDHPVLRIDQAWANLSLKPYVRDIQTVNKTSSDRRIHMSDHLAVIVSLDLHPISSIEAAL